MSLEHYTPEAIAALDEGELLTHGSNKLSSGPNGWSISDMVMDDLNGREYPLDCPEWLALCILRDACAEFCMAKRIDIGQCGRSYWHSYLQANLAFQAHFDNPDARNAAAVKAAMEEKR